MKEESRKETNVDWVMDSEGFLVRRDIELDDRRNK